MKVPATDWADDADMRRLLAALDGSAGRTRFVGGCVRDTLLDLPVADVDLATQLLPEEVIRRLNEARIKAVPTGLAHGTVTAVLHGRPVEVTTLRRDVSTDGRRATVAFTDDWREDAARRDFTINALSVDPESHTVFDYFDGLADLQARRVRFIGNPLTRIAEDHLRILRFFRFHARFGTDEPDAEGLEACAARANDLMALSRERIASELLRLLALQDPVPTVQIMIDRGIFRPVLPEIATADPLAALVAREHQAGIAGDPVRRLAALIPADPELAAGIAARLRLSRKQAQRLASAALAEIGEPRGLAYRIGLEAAVDRLLLHGKGPHQAASLKGWQPPRLPIGGGDLVRAGIHAGPEVARLLCRIEDQWVGEDFPDEPRVRQIMQEALAGAGGSSAQD